MAWHDESRQGGEEDAMTIMTATYQEGGGRRCDALLLLQRRRTMTGWISTSPLPPVVMTATNTAVPLSPPTNYRDNYNEESKLILSLMSRNSI
jgi:hypothetical protein